MTRHEWSEIKAGIKPEARTRLEVEGRLLSERLRGLADTERQKPHPADDGRNVTREPGRDTD